MAEVVPPEALSYDPEIFTLDLAGTDRFSWRLRSKPCMDADEIAEFHHGDRVLAVRSASHPGWLKLVDKSGWVKESHESTLVWKAAQPQSSAQAADTESSSPSNSSGLKDAKEFAEGSKCKAEFDEDDMSPSCTGSSASQSSPASQAQPLWPVPFSGKGCRMGEDEYPFSAATPSSSVTSAVTTSRWFTGQSCKIPESPVEISNVIIALRKARPRWSDLEDTDEEESPRLYKTDVRVPFEGARLETQEANVFCSAQLNDDYEGSTIASTAGTDEEPTQETVAKDKMKLKMEARRALVDGQSEDYANAKTAAAKAEMEDVQTLRTDQLDAAQPETRLVNAPTTDEQVVLKSRRHKRNKNLLQKKGKTQMCQYLVKEGVCPFGDSCWFAHSESDLKEQGNAEKENSSIAKIEEKAQDEVEHKEEVRNPRKRNRNKALLKQRNKTEFCKYLSDQGCCPFGDTCWFAHSVEELQSKDGN